MLLANGGTQYATHFSDTEGETQRNFSLGLTAEAMDIFFSVLNIKAIAIFFSLGQLCRILTLFWLVIEGLFFLVAGLSEKN